VSRAAALMVGPAGTGTRFPSRDIRLTIPPELEVGAGSADPGARRIPAPHPPLQTDCARSKRAYYGVPRNLDFEVFGLRPMPPWT
jgi:hypothetical protein